MFRLYPPTLIYARYVPIYIFTSIFTLLRLLKPLPVPLEIRSTPQSPLSM
jgi:hypothetical protein